VSEHTFVAVEHRAELAAVIRGGPHGSRSSTSEGRARQRPAIDLSPAYRLPLNGGASVFDRVLLDPGQSRPAGLDHRRVDDLSADPQPAP
jgi:hypothetical protein